MKTKELFAAVTSGVAVLLELLGLCLGGWDIYLVALVISMVLDYVMGLLIAAFWQNSPKTKDGKLSSRAGWKGLVRKVMTLVFVGIGYLLQMLTGMDAVRKMVILFFLTNELLSLLENAGLMGLKLPPVMTNAIELLSQKEEPK